MRLQWNTGRSYTNEGQRIIAETVEGGIIFLDMDRHIDGFIPTVRPPTDNFELKEIVMFNYDHTQYGYHEDARKLEWI